MNTQNTSIKRITKLSDLSHIPHTNPDYPQAVVAKAREALCKANLRHDNRYGNIRTDAEEIERYLSQTDFIPHTSEEDVMRWEFSKHINNAASRLASGHSATK